MKNRKPIEPRQVAWRSLLTAQALLVQKMDDELTTAGVLGMDAYDVLLVVCEAPESRIRLSELAAATLLTRSGITRLTDRLERDGLLRREDVPNDRRGSYAVLTEKGAAALKRTWAVYEKLITRHFGDHLSDDEAEVLQNALARIVTAARKPEIVPLTVRKRPESS
ncbi:family transcriptional regulator : Transcriptional regulator, MarR family OS=Fimbriimonas ginsengisoli Gsoil 348 GN=OP10G_2769 PE=4 SV=1: MarR_2 [Gemmata massiliana]|uniref:HTH marR-type domain-containing protein n=1 Tax=Gemmata massiliana TaxID=1210884 RepID=A0A6P2D7W5_9BACT|nr:MarR family transcriptional regulator [Gemmata massiliana]VTR95592.1 family transcriptional regulator : Transcriptional regulator, MarR family OS=Fimbriimonas ginsengisoli Gsoil 348 GN=OP10G_2769 PE=4 SV=1: MarR_2 [Gemmata massiliana]